MSETPGAPTSIWSRVVFDREFCEAVIADPLRALADTPGVTATPDQVRRLEAMSVADRETAVREVVREVTLRRAREQWGDRVWRPDDEAEMDVMFMARDIRPPSPETKGDDDDDDRDEEAFVG